MHIAQDLCGHLFVHKEAIFGWLALFSNADETIWGCQIVEISSPGGKFYLFMYEVIEVGTFEGHSILFFPFLK